MLTPITILKPLCLQTVLTSERSPTPIVVPDQPDFRELAAHIADALSIRSGYRFPVIPQAQDAEPGPPPGEGSAILIGHSMCLPALAHLYDQHYVYCDALYPGPGGYVVRTVHNPFGDGRNFVVLGGSNFAGVARAVKRFLAELGPGPELTLGHRILVQTDALPLKTTPTMQRDADATIRYHLTEGNRNRAFFSALSAGLLYHLTGHSGWA